jgi:hypothetical protein
MDSYQQGSDPTKKVYLHKKCDVCETLFIPKNKNKKRCSNECGIKAKRLNNANHYKNNKSSINAKARARYDINPEYYKERDKERWRRKREERDRAKILQVGEKESFEVGVIAKNKTSNVKTSSNKCIEKNACLRASENSTFKTKSGKKSNISQLSRDNHNRRKREKYHSDELYAIKNRIRSLINMKLRARDFTKSCTTEKYLGCNIQVLMAHLEENFRDGMSWDNRDEWHIDHIVPISRAKNHDDFIMLSHYSNLHPMWAKENIRKSNELGFYNVTGKMIDKYAQREEYQQYRYETIVSFNCHICRRNKKSKLVVVYRDDWSKIVCNGCYGRALSRKGS